MPASALDKIVTFAGEVLFERDLPDSNQARGDSWRTHWPAQISVTRSTMSISLAACKSSLTHIDDKNHTKRMHIHGNTTSAEVGWPEKWSIRPHQCERMINICDENSGVTTTWRSKLRFNVKNCKTWSCKETCLALWKCRVVCKRVCRRLGETKRATVVINFLGRGWSQMAREVATFVRTVQDCGNRLLATPHRRNQTGRGLFSGTCGEHESQKRPKTSEYIPTIHVRGMKLVRQDHFSINFFHMGATFFFFSAIFMSSTYTDKNNPCFRWTNRHPNLVLFPFQAPVAFPRFVFPMSI